VSATDKLLGRSTAGAGIVEEIACTAAGRALLDDADAAAQRATLGATTVGQALFTVANPSAVRFVQINADNSVTLNSAANAATALGLGTGSAPSFIDLNVNDAAGTNRDLNWNTAGSLRWRWRANSTAESGSNAGSDFSMVAFDDAGATLGTVFSIVRSTQVWTFAQIPIVGTASVGDNTTKGASTAYVDRAAVIPIIVACGDETTAITAGTGKVTFRMPYAATLVGVRASCNTAPTGSTIIIDINESGTTVLSTKLSIDTSEKTSTTAASAAVISDSALADDAEITIDFDQVGSTVAGAGVKVTLLVRKAA
jgi:hypothetical protein